MVLGTPLLDASGMLVCKSGTKLTGDMLVKLAIYGVSEIFIDDPLSTDIPAQPLVPPALEAQAAQALRQLLTEARDANSIDDSLIEPIMKPAHDIARGLYPLVLGEANVAACPPGEAYAFVQPARAAGLAAMLAAKSGYGADDAVRVAAATLLMNVGYVGVPPEILEKTEPLTAEEEVQLSKHPGLGYKLLKASRSVSEEVRQTVLLHHERWNGSGYPTGLAAEAIPHFARIVSVADTFYSLVSARPRRDAMLPHEAIEYVMAFGGEEFDSELVHILARELPAYPTGVAVRLNTGETGVVIDANVGHIGRPLLRIYLDSDGQNIREPYELDLADPQSRDLVVVATHGF